MPPFHTIAGSTEPPSGRFWHRKHGKGYADTLREGVVPVFGPQSGFPTLDDAGHLSSRYSPIIHPSFGLEVSDSVLNELGTQHTASGDEFFTGFVSKVRARLDSILPGFRTSVGGTVNATHGSELAQLLVDGLGYSVARTVETAFNSPDSPLPSVPPPRYIMLDDPIAGLTDSRSQQTYRTIDEIGKRMECYAPTPLDVLVSCDPLRDVDYSCLRYGAPVLSMDFAPVDGARDTGLWPYTITGEGVVSVVRDGQLVKYRPTRTDCERSIVHFKQVRITAAFHRLGRFFSSTRFLDACTRRGPANVEDVFILVRSIRFALGQELELSVHVPVGRSSRNEDRWKTAILPQCITGYGRRDLRRDMARIAGERNITQPLQLVHDVEHGNIDTGSNVYGNSTTRTKLSYHARMRDGLAVVSIGVPGEVTSLVMPRATLEYALQRTSGRNATTPYDAERMLQGQLPGETLAMVLNHARVLPRFDPIIEPVLLCDNYYIERTEKGHGDNVAINDTTHTTTRGVARRTIPPPGDGDSLTQQASGSQVDTTGYGGNGRNVSNRLLPSIPDEPPQQGDDQQQSADLIELSSHQEDEIGVFEDSAELEQRMGEEGQGIEERRTESSEYSRSPPGPHELALNECLVETLAKEGFQKCPPIMSSLEGSSKPTTTLLLSSKGVGSLYLSEPSKASSPLDIPTTKSQPSLDGLSCSEMSSSTTSSTNLPSCSQNILDAKAKVDQWNCTKSSKINGNAPNDNGMRTTKSVSTSSTNKRSRHSSKRSFTRTPMTHESLAECKTTKSCGVQPSPTPSSETSLKVVRGMLRASHRQNSLAQCMNSCEIKHEFAKLTTAVGTEESRNVSESSNKSSSAHGSMKTINPSYVPTLRAKGTPDAELVNTGSEILRTVKAGQPSQPSETPSSVDSYAGLLNLLRNCSLCSESDLTMLTKKFSRLSSSVAGGESSALPGTSQVKCGQRRSAPFSTETTGSLTFMAKYSKQCADSLEPYSSACPNSPATQLALLDESSQIHGDMQDQSKTQHVWCTKSTSVPTQLDVVKSRALEHCANAPADIDRLFSDNLYLELGSRLFYDSQKECVNYLQTQPIMNTNLGWTYCTAAEDRPGLFRLGEKQCEKPLLGLTLQPNVYWRLMDVWVPVDPSKISVPKSHFPVMSRSAHAALDIPWICPVDAQLAMLRALMFPTQWIALCYAVGKVETAHMTIPNTAARAALSWLAVRYLPDAQVCTTRKPGRKFIYVTCTYRSNGSDLPLVGHWHGSIHTPGNCGLKPALCSVISEVSNDVRYFPVEQVAFDDVPLLEECNRPSDRPLIDFATMAALHPRLECFSIKELRLLIDMEKPEPTMSDQLWQSVWRSAQMHRSRRHMPEDLDYDIYDVQQSRYEWAQIRK